MNKSFQFRLPLLPLSFTLATNDLVPNFVLENEVTHLTVMVVSPSHHLVRVHLVHSHEIVIRHICGIGDATYSLVFAV